jgi:hypothetical protein
MVCKLKKSIYVLKQALQVWNIRFDETAKSYSSIQNVDEPCMYRKTDRNDVSFLVLYVDDILLIRNDVRTLSSIKVWLSSQFRMKDMGETSYILGIKAS